MKRISTLAAVVALTASAVSVQAQITLDGKVSSGEIGTGTGQYQLIGTYTGPHAKATEGLQALYVATTATKMYVGVVCYETSAFPTFGVYLNTPGATGIPVGTALPGSSESTDSFQNMPKMDFEVDYAIRVTPEAITGSNGYVAGHNYTVAASQRTDLYQGAAQKSGTNAGQVLNSSTAATTLAPFRNARFTYLSTPNSSLAAATATGAGFEFELDLATLGLTAGNDIQLFAAYMLDGGSAGGNFTGETIPMITGRTSTTPLGSNADFTAQAGNQYATYRIGTGVLAVRSEVAKALNFSVYPNPGHASTVTYRVPAGTQGVALSVFDNMGRQVRSFQSQQAGEQSYALAGLSAGIYVVKLAVGDQITSQKLAVE